MQLEIECIRLKRERNQLLPVQRLPAELLLQIINLAWTDCAPRHWEPVFLVGVTHVCSYWREISLTASQLWSRICLKNPRYFA
ncbi:hypothetical protein GLOTRDRAFT_51031, partial [Gloeophyllum trabeum ATCC 11539]